MTMTVKQLILILQDIDNHLSEVEIETYDKQTILPSIHSVIKVNRKVIIRPDRSYRQ